ncbi:hypothetical protein KP509_07G080000 [Ceratopteris richardii]|uniref:RING-type E3 ubiquitin transferase n=1 Tax=Ceratopteris richardii TaxID=49495 RepID=A0A8T2UIK4_CERRI|nr:hypothetical protein KP509_07G080000 [Ceratopteris richardii]
MRSNSCGGAQKSQDECAVCLNPFQEQERVTILPTREHLFHVSCIDMWLQSHPNCPLCRQNITLPAIHKFLSGLELHGAEDQNPSDSPANNGEFLALFAVDHLAHHTTGCDGILRIILQFTSDPNGGFEIDASERQLRCRSLPSQNDRAAFQIKCNAYGARSADGTHESLKFSKTLKVHNVIQLSPCERVHPNSGFSSSYRRLCWIKTFPTSLRKSLSTGSFVA